MQVLPKKKIKFGTKVRNFCKKKFGTKFWYLSTEFWYFGIIFGYLFPKKKNQIWAFGTFGRSASRASRRRALGCEREARATRAEGECVVATTLFQPQSPLLLPLFICLSICHSVILSVPPVLTIKYSSYLCLSTPQGVDTYTYLQYNMQ